MKSLILLLTAAFFAPTLLADPPARCGRLSVMEGAVSFRPAGVDEWAAATPNRPLTTGDRVWTDTNARAEIEVGSTALRLSSATEVDITSLDDQTMQISVPQGSVTARVRTLEGGAVYEMDTPNAAVAIGQPGVYRVDVSSDGSQATVSVRTGQVNITSAGSTFEVQSGQRATINGTDTPTYDVADVGPTDAFDQWSDERDHRHDNSASARYVSPEIGGYDDLDDYGQWRDDPTYGSVWVPTAVEAGWVPYHEGHWVWHGRWGWTWVDDAPWGWAPFHYGRWAYVEDRWAWCPGRVDPHPVYAPALVAFVGGSNWSVGVGWFALAPEEPWYPSYRVSNTYVRNVNVTNVTNINIVNVTNVTNVTTINYRNRHVPGALVAVPTTAFRDGSSVSRFAVRVPPNEVARAPLSGFTPPVTPTRASLFTTAAAHRPPAALAERPVYAVHKPPPAPVPFSVQQSALEHNNGRPLASTELAKLRPTAPATPTIVRPAGVVTHPGVTLTPARAGAPPAQPVRSQGFLPPARVTTLSHTGQLPPTPPARTTPAPTQPTPPAAPERSNVPQPPPRPTLSTAPTPSPSLARSYNLQRSQMEQRHLQESSQPPAAAPAPAPEDIAKQHATEHRTLDDNYVQARVNGAPKMPPAPPAPHPVAPPRPASPPPRPASPPKGRPH